ncbi:hypothetical protein TNCT_482861 [Trichonephila clavata]|uniref:Uncharacterized protein n=1 Tax=Trichonephila clavata TaxID=2740835 RepID=A0A8X6LKN2_TRICU|nr:hypothetical protein TNCT_482861 [Trichonephila clavata]
MSDVILMSTFVLLHSLWCLFEIFGHFNLQYCLHLIPYYIFIELLKLKSRNLKREVQKADKEINIFDANTQQEEKIEMRAEIADKTSIKNYEDNEINTTKEERNMSDFSAISIHEDMDTFSSGMEKTKSFKKFSSFTQRRNISGTTEQTSAHSIEITLAKYSKYVFYADYEEKFTIDNVEFEEEEKELTDIFNSNSEILPTNPFYERAFYSEKYHFLPIPLNASQDNYTDDDVQENEMPNSLDYANLEILPTNPFYERGSYSEDYHMNPIPLNASPNNYTHVDVQENDMPNSLSHANLEILPTNPFYERGSYSEDYHMNPIPLNASPDNYTDEDVQENDMPNSLNFANLEILPTNPFYERASYSDYHMNPIPLNASLGNYTDDDVQENNMPNSPNYANLEILPTNPFYERVSYSEEYHLNPIPLNASPDNYTDEDVQENGMPNSTNYANLEILPTNPFYERASYSEDYHMNPIPLSASPENRTDEDVQENAVDSSRKKKVFRKVISFFKKLRNDNCNGFAYKRFK